MTYPLTTKTVLSMDESLKDAIINAGVPFDFYTKGYVNLGPNNRSALNRIADIAYRIGKNHFPLPPSPFMEYVVGQTSSPHDKQDYRMSMDAKKPGDGKSYSAAFLEQWYAYLMAQENGQNPKDYFSLENCALLEDSEGVVKLLNETEKYQAVMIDDAGVAAGSKEHQTQRNINFNKIMMTCRTKRWFVIMNAPLVTDIDLKTRELMYGKAFIFKPFHDRGFNIMKKHIIDTRVIRNQKWYNERRMVFHGKKIDFWIAYHPDYFDAFKGFAAKYDEQRERQANDLISNVLDKQRKLVDTRSKREKTFQMNFDKYLPVIRDMCDKDQNVSLRAISRKVPLSDPTINKIIAIGGVPWVQKKPKPGKKKSAEKQKVSQTT